MAGVPVRPERPDDLSQVVDATGIRFGFAGDVKDGEAPASVEEAVALRDGTETPGDLSGVVDVFGCGSRRAGHIELGEAPAGIEKAMLFTT